MPTRLSYICDRVIEAGWLAALVFVPLYFNVYSSRVFEPDKISFLRNLVAFATIAWIIKLVEQFLGKRSPGNRAAAVVEQAAPGWAPSWLRVPMALPMLIYAAIFLFTTITSVVPLTSIFGSYQRFQGTISQYTYIMLAVLIIANMRSRGQLERFITFAIAASVPVGVYGIIQATGHDPLPWAGDVQTRVASTMGNAIFVAAYLIMVVPLTLQRLIAAFARLRSNVVETVAPRASEDQPWALAIIGSGVVFLAILLQYAGFVTGNGLGADAGSFGFGDILMWLILLAAAGLFIWAANNVAGQALAARTPTRRGEEASSFSLPVAAAVLVPIVQMLAFVVGIWIVGSVRVSDFRQWIVLPIAIFIIYALTYLFTFDGAASRASASLQIVGMGLLLVIQILVIFLSQSRGPQIGMIAGLAVFGFALLLRRRMYRQVAVLGALAVLFFGFLVVFNLPDSPIASWRDAPYIGRLGLLSQFDEGTGKVRELIWGGAINLIESDPVRTVIGWGPESMYVAYNKFYPPELGHWELRNATPDRSHDVFLDQLVTMGVIGLLGYLFLFGSFIWFCVRALRKAPRLGDQLIIAGFLAVVISHIFELITGIQIAATYTLFYGAIGCVAALGYFMTDYLRNEEPAAVAAVDEPALITADSNGVGEFVEPEPALVGATGRTATARAGSANGRNGSGALAATAPGKKATATVNNGNGNGNGSGRKAPQNGSSRITPQGGRSGSPRGATVRPATVSFSNAIKSPLAVGLYTVVILLGALYVVGLNVNAVKADMFYKQGLSADQAQQWQSAVIPYDKAISISPTEDFYYLFLGRAYMEWARTVASTNTTQAIQLLNNAQTELLDANHLNPLNTDHYANLARLYVFWGDTFGDTSKYTLALKYYAQAHELSPGNATIWDEYGLALAKSGDIDGSLAALRNSTTMDPTYDQSHFLLADTLRARSNQIAAEAAITGTTTEMSATLTLSATQLMQEAGAQYGEAVKITPDIIQGSDLTTRVQDLIARQAITPLIAGYLAVIAQYQQAGTAEPVAARSSLGEIYSLLGQSSDAITQFERAVVLDCSSYNNLVSLGQLYQDTGQKQQALTTYQNALSVATCDPTAGFCSILQQSVIANSCSALTADSTMTQALTDLRARITQLKQDLGG